MVSISDVSVAEGNRGTTNAVFSLLLDRPSVQPVSVEYATSNGSAASGPDYVETNGIVSFAPGVTNGTITVVVKGDTLVEPNERFFINLFNPTNATIADQQAVGTIINDDGLPGNVDRFEWAAIASPQTVNQPFAVTVMARTPSIGRRPTFRGPPVRGELCIRTRTSVTAKCRGRSRWGRSTKIPACKSFIWPAKSERLG